MKNAPASSTPFFKRTLFFSLVAVVSGPAHAAFFQIQENSVSQLGNANAGGTAAAEDATTVWYNPAGVTRLSGSQLVVGGHFIDPSTKFSKTSATTVLGTNISGGNGGDAGESALVPNIYYTHQLNSQFFMGLGMNVPFGLATDYDDDWVGRYHAERSEIQSINLNASLAYKATDTLSFGGGINFQRLDAELTQAIDFATLCTSAGGAVSTACGAGGGFSAGSNPNDGFARIEADDDAWGYNVGMLWQLQDATRLGLAYRSKMKYSLNGTFDITAPANVPGAVLTGRGLIDSSASANITVPATLSASVFQQLTPQLALMADITRTYWSKLPELRIDFDSTQADSVVTLELKDVNRYSVGLTFTPGGNWTYRTGVALDQTPTPSAELRTPRLPDEDRLWLALGANYRASKVLSFDVAFVHIIADDADINKVATGTNENALRGNLNGTYEASVNILSAQANWSF